MTFIGKETFREGNIWLEGGGGGLPYSPFLYAYTDDMGDPSTFTKVPAPPVPVSTEFRTWFGFTYREDLPDTFVSDSDVPTPEQFAMTAGDVISRGGAFVDYGDGNLVSMTDGPPDQAIGYASGTSDDFPAGTSMTWRVLDADMTVIGERTIEFGAESGGGFYSAAYLMSNLEAPDPTLIKDDTRPVPATTASSYYVFGGVQPMPDSFLYSEGALHAGTIKQVVDAGGKTVAINGNVIAPDLRDYYDSMPDYVVMQGQIGQSPSPSTMEVIAPDDSILWSTSFDFTMTVVAQPQIDQIGCTNLAGALNVNRDSGVQNGDPPANDGAYQGTTMQVDWGDGSPITDEAFGSVTGNNMVMEHAYAAPGVYTVVVPAQDYEVEQTFVMHVLGGAKVTPNTVALADLATTTFTITAGCPLLPHDPPDTSCNCSVDNPDSGGLANVIDVSANQAYPAGPVTSTYNGSGSWLVTFSPPTDFTVEVGDYFVVQPQNATELDHSWWKNQFASWAYQVPGAMVTIT
jgi:hypothetical protein